MDIVWYIDDLNIFQKYPEEVTEIIIWLENRYGYIRVSGG